MTYKGTVKNGVVVLEGPRRPPDGTPVSVRELRPRARGPARGRNGPKTLYDGLKPFIGMASDMPADASLNVDHYLYNAPKRK